MARYAGGAALDPLLEPPDPLLGERGLVESDPLAELDEASLALDRVESVEDAAQRRVASELLLLGDDREPEVGRQHHEPQRPVVLGDEVLDRREDPVARAALVLGVVEVGVHPAARAERRDTVLHAGLAVGLAVLVGDPARLVVQVASAVGPPHVVEHQHRERGGGVPGRLGEQLELAVDRVPVVVAVDEHDVRRFQGGQHVVADAVVEHVATGEAPLVLGRVELRKRIDDVELARRAQLVEHPHRRVPPEGTDLDDPSGAYRVDDRGDDVLPVRVHRRETSPALLPIQTATAPSESPSVRPMRSRERRSGRTRVG